MTSQKKHIKLIQPRVGNALPYVGGYIMAIEALNAQGATLNYQHPKEFADLNSFFKHFLDEEIDKDLPAGIVPASTFWLVDSQTKKFLAQSHIRHQLTEKLNNYGGHVGYFVNPFRWEEGIGTYLLRLTLEECKKLNLGKVLVTCDKSNIGSRKIIERNGGQLENVLNQVIDGEAVETMRFWIDLL